MTDWSKLEEALPYSIIPTTKSGSTAIPPADSDNLDTAKVVTQSPSGTSDDSITARYLSTQKDTSGSSSTIFTPNTPIIGSLVSGVSALKDQWTQQLTNWKTLISGLTNYEDDPKTLYYVTNALLRMVQGPMEPEPYYNDTEGENIFISALKSIGIDSFLTAIGGSALSLGEQYLQRDYTDTPTQHYTSLEGSKSLSYVGDKKQGQLSGEIDHTETTNATSTYQFIKSLNGCPLFTVYEDGGFSSIFCGEELDTDLSSIEQAIAKRDWEAPRYLLESSASKKTESGGSVSALKRAIYNYSELVNPYDTLGQTATSPTDNIEYALKTLNALSGYEDFKGFAPRNDSNWNIRLYPYNPYEEYSFTKSDTRDEDYYAKIFTPPLPITYIPTWKTVYKSGTYGAACVMQEFDWEKTLPVVSYSISFGDVETANIDGLDQMAIPTRIGSLPKNIELSILDDVDSTFLKYLSKYFNTIIDNKRRARAPIFLSSFVMELVVFKPALKVNYMFRFIVVPVSYSNSWQLGSTADANSSISIEFSCLGMLDYNDKAQSPNMESQGLDYDAAAYTWRESSPVPPLYWTSEDKTNDEIVE